MSRRSRNELDESWIVNEEDEGGISWAEDDESPSEDEDKHSKRLQRSIRKSPLSTPQKVTAGKRRASAEPQFIMPSMETVTDQARRRNVSSRQSTPKTSQPRAISTRTTSSRTHNSTRSAGENQDSVEWAKGMLVGLGQAVVDILGDALKYLKKPISLFLAVYAFMIFVQLARNFVTNSIYGALSPMCRVPGITLLDLPWCRAYSNGAKLSPESEPPAPEFDALMDVQSQFETIIEDTNTGMSLPMDMKRSEASIRDLRQVVRFSQLPSRHELMHEFDGFVETARIASYDLQKFNSHVGRGVDIVLSTARWTQRVLDDIGHQQDQRGFLPSVITDTLLAPFKPLKFTESRLLDQYIEHTHIVSGEIEKLIEEAQALLQVLQNLEDRLEVIHAVSVQDNIHIQGTQDEILGDIWTYLGGNRAKQRQIDKQIKLLGRVTGYRKVAFDHVAKTVIKLQSMGAELEELRSRVGSAATLKEAGAKYVPLAVHIENIQLGVERLEIGRQRAKELEQTYVRKILDRAEIDAGSDIKYISAG